MDTKEAALLIDFLSGVSISESGFKDKITNYIVNEPEKAAQATMKAATLLEDNPNAPSGLGLNVAHQIDTIVSLVSEVKKDWGSYLESLLNLVLALDIKVRPYLLREGLDNVDEGLFVKSLVSKLPESEVIKTIIQSMRLKENYDDTRSLALFMVPTIEKRRKVVGYLQKAFSEGGISEEEYSKIVNDTLWKDLSFSEKAMLLIETDILGFGDTAEVVSIVNELLVQAEQEKAEKIINKIVSQINHPIVGIRRKAVILSKDLLEVIEEHDQQGKACNSIISLLCEKLLDSDPEIRDNALVPVVYKGNKLALPNLLKIVKKKGIFSKRENEEFRKKAIRALGKIGLSDAIPDLVKLLKSKSFLTVLENTDVRIAAVEALAMIGNDEAIEALRSVSTSDSREQVRRAAKEELEKLASDSEKLI